MTVKHTPGPWVYPTDGTGAPDLLIFSSVKPKNATSEYGPCVAQVRMHDVVVGFIRKGEYEANARLIAAAPDLLEALKLVLQHGRIDNSEERMNVVSAAIAKATGK